MELFSRVPDALSPGEDSRLTPIPTEEGISSLSAILMDDAYSFFLKAGARELNGLSFAGPGHLIPLKAKAWLDLSTRRAQGHKIDSRSIKKHRNDVLRLYRIINPDRMIETPVGIRRELALFIDRLPDQQIDLNALDLARVGLDKVATDLRRIYGLDKG
ncbi:MAG: hypothetical protein ABIF71_07710 [Planctomycetota bacterium]